MKTKLWSPPHGKILKKGKLVLNKNHDTLLEVAILTIEQLDNDEVHFVLNIGGSKELRFTSYREWQKFIKFVRWFDWEPGDTGVWEASHLEEEKEEPSKDTWQRPILHCCDKCWKENCVCKNPGDTLKLNINNFFADDENSS